MIDESTVLRSAYGFGGTIVDCVAESFASFLQPTSLLPNRMPLLLQRPSAK